VTDRNPEIDREGIHIDRDLADALHIEEELDANVVGVYRFPDPGRRRTYAWVLAAFAPIALLAIPGGWWVAAGFLIGAVWCWLSAWPLRIDEHEALRVAGSNVPFPVGHASASVRFKGLRARPRWSVVVYSAVDPPDARGLVVVDAVTGEVVETPYYEPIAPV
jgi:hypothetical protein